ncbi:MAG TPA: hypothetical protein VH724_18890 [Candidatus Angelobacter sp.]|nr:hypothetical protein [Candidatus Angelobacter sp.]
MEAASDYGVDLTLNLRSLTRTPAERVREMEAALKFAEDLRRAASRLGSMINFEATLKALADHHVNFVVVGGYASTLHGSAYLTRDLDICYERTPENMERLVPALRPYHPRQRGAPEGLPFSF